MQKAVYIETLKCHVLITRRKGTRSLRATIKDNATIKLTIPYGMPDQAALNFLLTKREWVEAKLKPRVILQDGNHIGKSHRLVFVKGASTRVSVRNQQIIVHHPEGSAYDDVHVQARAAKGAEKALLIEGNSLLPQRLHTLADMHGFTYASCGVKKLKSRWGSCDQNNNILLSIYLMQLPWPLIDYVLLHELVHTKHAHHQTEFWDELRSVSPSYKTLKTNLKDYPTAIQPTPY